MVLTLPSSCTYIVPYGRIARDMHGHGGLIRLYDLCVMKFAKRDTLHESGSVMKLNSAV